MSWKRSVFLVWHLRRFATATQDTFQNVPCLYSGFPQCIVSIRDVTCLHYRCRYLGVFSVGQASLKRNSLAPPSTGHYWIGNKNHFIWKAIVEPIFSSLDMETWGPGPASGTVAVQSGQPGQLGPDQPRQASYNMAAIYFFPAAGSPTRARETHFFTIWSWKENDFILSFPHCSQPCVSSRVSLQSLPANTPGRGGVRRAGSGAPAGTRAGLQLSPRHSRPLPAQGRLGCQLLACGFFTHSIFCQLLGLCPHAVFSRTKCYPPLKFKAHVTSSGKPSLSQFFPNQTCRKTQHRALWVCLKSAPSSDWGPNWGCNLSWGQQCQSQGPHVVACEWLEEKVLILLNP